MATTDNERYLRYIYLLGKGGPLVLKGIVDREVNNECKTLKEVLMNNCNRIRARLGNNKAQYERLFPSAGAVNTVLDSWDISLLCTVILTCFGGKLTPQDRNDITIIRTSRNEIQGHFASLSLEESDYNQYIGSLIQSLLNLACGLDHQIYDMVQDSIKMAKSGSLEDLKEYQAEVHTQIENQFGATHIKLDTIHEDVKLVKARELSPAIHQRFSDLETKQEDLKSDTRDIKQLTEDNKQLLQTIKGEWQAIDDAKTSQGLCEEGLLDSIQLKKLISNEGRTSPNVKNECDKICAALKTVSDQIVHIWPSYTLKDDTAIVFVVIAKKDIELDVSWTLKVRILHQYSEESKIAMYCEENIPLSTERSRQIGDIIDKYAVELMQNHSYLSAISASSDISRDYGSINQKILRQSCIVLSVLVKQFIPINEEPFPTMLDGMPIDVREGGVQFCGPSAEDFHDQVRMGCKISSSSIPQKFGTLGGFVAHPEYGLCGFTCEHAILNDKKKLKVKGKGRMKGEELGLCEIFQPSYASENKIGRVVEVTYKEGTTDKSGVDLALFKIEQRPPSEGNFPDNQGTATTDKYESGKVWGKNEIPTHQPIVQKFGVGTGLTYGEIHFDNAVVKEIEFHSEMEIDSNKLTTTLYKQYHIKSNDVNVRFSDLGDSGALVFMKDHFDQEGDLRCIGMLEGVWNDNTCVVTPITAILEELKVTQLKSFIPIVTWKKIDERLREMEERLMRAITRGNTNEQSPSQ